MTELRGRRALVTGAGRGIGRVVALDLARAGADVVLASRTRSEVEAVAEEVRGLGVRALALTADVSRSEDVREMFKQARAGLGSIDVLVNGAGIAPSALVVKTSDELWHQAIETNLSGAFYCIREALPEMIERGWGRVVTIASIAGKTGYPYISAYAASKHGVLGLTKCVALEAVSRGVTVNAVCPGYVDTPMTDNTVALISEKTGRSEAEARRVLESNQPTGRLVTSDEVAEAVLFCVRTPSVNGQGINVDGGAHQS